MANKSLQINGPFFTNYSYARMNRGLGLALDKIQKEFSISLYGDKDKIDYYPSESELEKKLDLKRLFKNNPENDVVIYNNFPKSGTSLHDLESLPGKTKLAYIAWEESIYPKQWVDEINKNLHGVMTISSFTKEVLKNSGVKVPIESVPIALDNDFREKPSGRYPLETKKIFKFLHISTAKKRKGVDVLLKSYFKSFNKNDNVVLVLKTTPGPDNYVDFLIRELQNENSPEILHINTDLSEEDLKNLHASADCEVYPTRAEGFGLPILEAMYQGIPVITTNYSGQLEFCNEQNSYLINYKLDYTRESEMVNIGAKWAEPDENHLSYLMQYVFKNKNTEEVKKKIINAKETAEKYSWENTAKNVLDFVRKIEKIRDFKNHNAAVITPFNDETGIAEYSKKLYEGIEFSFSKFFYISNKDISDQVEKDNDRVIRLWEVGEESFNETLEFIKENNIKIIHIQYHSGSFFSVESLGNLIKTLKDLNLKVYLTFHAFRSSNFDYLKDVKNLEKVDKIFIHNPNDAKYASEILNNIEYFILPTIEFKKRNKSELREKLGVNNNDVIVASHGLMNTNKNIPEIITAVSEIKDLKFFSVNAVSSNNIHSSGIYEHCKKLVEDKGLQNNIFFFPQFLDDYTIEILLQAADIIVFNYTEVGESASASIRKALASLNPVIVTDINMFSEFRDEVLKIKDSSSESVKEGIEEILNSSDLKPSLVQNAQKFIEENLYDNKALRTLEIYSNSF